MTHENAEDLTANVLVGRSVRHRSTIVFARYRAMAARQQWTRLHNRGAACPLLGVKQTSFLQRRMSAYDPKRTSGLIGI